MEYIHIARMVGRNDKWEEEEEDKKKTYLNTIDEQVWIERETMKSSEQINESHNPVASCVHWKHLHLQTIIYLSVSPCVSIYMYMYMHMVHRMNIYMSIPMCTRMHRHIFENWRQSSAQREPTPKARTMRTEECTETATQKLQAITTLILSQHSFFTYDFNIFLFGLLFICCWIIKKYLKVWATCRKYNFMGL